MIEPIRHELLRAEVEVLTGHGLTMWAYVVLLNLTAEPTRTQAALADAIKADRTRIIDVLDDLQDRGLISRRPGVGAVSGSAGTHRRGRTRLRSRLLRSDGSRARLGRPKPRPRGSATPRAGCRPD